MAGSRRPPGGCAIIARPWNRFGAGSCQSPLLPETIVARPHGSKKAASRVSKGGGYGTERHKSFGSPVHRAGGPVPERQDDAARSDPRPHRRDPAPGHGRGRHHGRRRQQGGAPPPDERRALGRHHRLSWATAILSSIVPARSNSSTTCARRCRRSMPRSWSASWTRRRCRSCSSSCASSKTRTSRASCSSTRSTRPTPTVHDVLKLLQPASRMKLLLRQIPTFSGEIITGFVDLALERAFVYKEHAAVRGHPARRRRARSREDRALLHAGDARRSRRRADGAIARGHPAAARQGVRRSRQGTARRPGLPGADRLGDAHQRRAAAAEGAAPRGARRRRAPPSGSA